MPGRFVLVLSIYWIANRLPKNFPQAPACPWEANSSLHVITEQNGQIGDQMPCLVLHSRPEAQNRLLSIVFTKWPYYIGQCWMPNAFFLDMNLNQSLTSRTFLSLLSLHCYSDTSFGIGQRIPCQVLFHAGRCLPGEAGRASDMTECMSGLTCQTSGFRSHGLWGFVPTILKRWSVLGLPRTMRKFIT